MSYAGGTDIGTLRFLAANVIYQATQQLLTGDDGSDRGVLDDATLLMDVVASYYTEQDQDFQKEWRLIQKERQEAQSKVKPGFQLDDSVTEAYRWRELKAMFRSLCRKGTFVRQESPSAEWIPKVQP